MIYGLIDRKQHDYYSYLGRIFKAINNAQKNYNWLVTDYECYPQNQDIENILNREYCWFSGEELSGLVEKEDFQWIWGVFCGFEKDIPLSEILKSPLPTIIDNNQYYKNPISLQHPLSTVEILSVDSAYTLIVSKNKEIIDDYVSVFPKTRELSDYNEELLSRGK